MKDEATRARWQPALVDVTDARDSTALDRGGAAFF
jgi:hypothetical protein